MSHSTYHQYVKYLLPGGQRTTNVDSNSFSSANACHAKVQFYKVKGKFMAGDKDVSVKVFIRYLLTGFTRPVKDIH